MNLPALRALKRAERFLESLVYSRPRPHYVAPARGARPPPFTLARIRALLAALGHPEDGLAIAHIAGTSGKTSTSYFTAAILSAHGLRTGLHTSPHIRDVCERFMIDGAPCEPRELLALIDEVKPVLDLELSRSEEGPASYFELVLALALRHFARRGCDAVVLEAGLGGRYDASNAVARPTASILTGVGLDHTNVLGETKAEIARDKVGIARSGVPIITFEQDPNIVTILEDEARAAGTRLHRLGVDFAIEGVRADRRATVFDHRSERGCIAGIEVAALGAFQARNAALAIEGAAQILGALGRPLQPDLVREGLRTAKVPGRFEVIGEAPLVILDGAHNPEKMAAFAAAVTELYPKHRFLVVYGATSGRDLLEILAPLARLGSGFYLTRAMARFREDEDPKVLAGLLRELKPDARPSLFLDPALALAAARHDAAGTEGLGILVTGSLYLVSYIHEVLAESADA